MSHATGGVRGILLREASREGGKWDLHAWVLERDTHRTDQGIPWVWNLQTQGATKGERPQNWRGESRAELPEVGRGGGREESLDPGGGMWEHK